MNISFRKLRFLGGDDGIRTHDPLLAGQVLSQLSYTPIIKLLGFAVSIFGMIIFHFSFLHFSFATVRLHGRPKWTRTTDLVLIRHAL